MMNVQGFGIIIIGLTKNKLEELNTKVDVVIGMKVGKEIKVKIEVEMEVHMRDEWIRVEIEVHGDKSGRVEGGKV